MRRPWPTGGGGRFVAPKEEEKEKEIEEEEEEMHIIHVLSLKVMHH